MKETIKETIMNALKNLSIDGPSFEIEHPDDRTNGDYSTNAAMINTKILKTNPRELAGKIKKEIESKMPDGVEKIEIAGGGFINFFLARNFFSTMVDHIAHDEHFGKNDSLASSNVIIEYTDPNPFKEFHIGHLMSNTIGEALSRIIEWNGGEVKRACYQGDVGLHVAKAIWALKKSGEKSFDIEMLAKAYAEGSKAYAEEIAKKEIEEINKKIYEKDKEIIDEYWAPGKKISLEHFEELYKKLGTKFDYYFFESECGEFGKKVVEEHIEKGIFEKSDGAVVFKAEAFDPKLHTRVFINSQGLPTYEAKELGLAKIKHEKYPYALSVVVTGNEINDYFRVLLCAMKQVFPELSEKTTHISHGMLRLPSGKMSSRTGDVITGESLLSDIGEKVMEKIQSSDKTMLSSSLVNDVSVAALKYSILKQAPGKDIIFSFEKSISFEGDSGPYLQYAHARAFSLLEKAEREGVEPSYEHVPDTLFEIERILYRFPEVILLAQKTYAPQLISGYLIELARSFNSLYGREQIISKDDEFSPYKILITKAFVQVLRNGLTVLGMQAPEKM